MIERSSDLHDAPESLPAPMSHEDAKRLARRIWGALGAAKRQGRACVVGLRAKHGGHTVDGRGMGDSWERAFDAALRNEGR